MALKKTVSQLKELLEEITVDLGKAEGGNRAAAQRVRTGTIKLGKIAKDYRKESIEEEKKGAKKKNEIKETRSRGMERDLFCSRTI